MTKLIFAFVLFLLFLWRIRMGYRNGVMQEIVTILSGAIALASVALLFLAISSYRQKAMSLLVVCVIGLTVLGVVFKVCGLIFKPMLALGDVAVISGVNKLFGAVIGAGEAAVLSCLFYFIYEYLLRHMGTGAL